MSFYKHTSKEWLSERQSNNVRASELNPRADNTPVSVYQNWIESEALMEFRYT